ncbi:protein ASPARTIC PROTEASE IN GUARD CELL 2-like [Corylus avellana]|uniref:protein ASPARTIC PROTEASE IN GUARD CELL 2-like n=1 Tax=Corylus avellana TaxID=13451 RepID=UPI00286C1D2A|nr:protein ASPARTIC PROTEASE IN GUARD CELL 2-like [Corylus avellana]
MRIYFVFWCSLSLVCTSLALKLDVVRHDQTIPSLRSELFTTDHAAYLIPVGMGSPPNSLYLVLDLSISALWVQCTQQQVQPSPSFAEILPCGLVNCERFPNTDCHKGECRYKLKSSDKAYTQGKVGLDTITIGDVVIQNVAVACGLKKNSFFTAVPGIMGLGRGMSFLDQIYGLSGGVFSYCLPSLGPKSGWEELSGNRPTWVRSLYKQWNPTVYYVEQSGLGVGSKWVSRTLPEGIFRLTPKGDGGAIIDIIAFVTTLPKVAYEVFRDTYVAEASNLPRTFEDSVFDTCFRACLCL